jgi:uncharacterized OB-fold protein
MCGACGSADWTWERSCGTGSVYSFTVTHRVLHPAFTVVPYAHGIIETDEGVHILASLVDVQPDQIEIGMRVELGFKALREDVVIPVYRPVAGEP